MSLYYGKRATPARSGIGARRTTNNDDFDDLWERSSESSSEEPEAQVPAAPVKQTCDSVAVREPTRKEIMSVQRLYGDKMTELEIIAYLKKRFAREAESSEWVEPQTIITDGGWNPEVLPTHYSSDDRLPKQPSQYWSPQHYQHQQAISSEELFPEQRRVGVRETLRNTITQVVNDLTGPPDDFS